MFEKIDHACKLHRQRAARGVIFVRGCHGFRPRHFAHRAKIERVRQQAQHLQPAREALRKVHVEITAREPFDDFRRSLVGADQCRHLELVLFGQRGVDETGGDEEYTNAAGRQVEVLSRSK